VLRILKTPVHFIERRAARFEVVQPLCPFIMDKAYAFSATSDHPKIHNEDPRRAELKFFLEGLLTL